MRTVKYRIPIIDGKTSIKNLKIEKLKTEENLKMKIKL